MQRTMNACVDTHVRNVTHGAALTALTAYGDCSVSGLRAH